ncbi:MAG: hypothetical protein M3N04_06840, partial [Actinomycetota bacterium]|nr:hypothetical protein [Actinomycetota bacterium]
PDEPQPLLPEPDLPPIEPAPPAPRPAQPAPPLEPLTAVVGESANAIERALQRIGTALASPTTPGGS